MSSRRDRVKPVEPEDTSVLTSRTLRSTRSQRVKSTALSPDPIAPDNSVGKSSIASTNITRTKEEGLVELSSALSPLARIEAISSGSRLPHIDATSLVLLRKKQQQLSLNAAATLDVLPNQASFQNALAATFIFAQYEAGTAVCIDEAGWILTCAHCFGDNEEEYKASNKKKWLLSYSGLAVLVECKVWDPKRDLALLKVIAIETDDTQSAVIPAVKMSKKDLAENRSIFCIGQPGRDDLESASKRKTNYNLFEVSKGKFRGMVLDVDPQDNSEIGALKHDAWTYWGHSGAPLLAAVDGTLIGLHSSWDDETAMRHGVPRAAIVEFLQKGIPAELKALMSVDVIQV